MRVRIVSYSFENVFVEKTERKKRERKRPMHLNELSLMSSGSQRVCNVKTPVPCSPGTLMGYSTAWRVQQCVGVHMLLRQPLLLPFMAA